jgi:uncharacterized protein
VNATPPTPWGLWPTLLLTVVLIIAASATEILTAIVYTLNHAPVTEAGTDLLTHIKQAYAHLSPSGDLLSIILTLRSLLGLGLIALFCALRRDLPIRQYLALQPIPWRALLIGVVILLAYLLLTETIYYMAGRDPIGDFMRDTYASTHNLPFLWFTIIITAPIFEEVLFRGFVYAGLRQSWLGYSGTILFTAICFAIVHMQYAVPEMFVVLGLGLLLGVARWRTGSVYLPIAIHSVNNLAATLQIALLNNAS